MSGLWMTEATAQRKLSANKLPVATATTPGVIKAGTGVSVAADGTISVTATGGGTNGTNGQPAYSTIGSVFTSPSVGSTSNMTLANTSWLAQGSYIYIFNVQTGSYGGLFQVQGVINSTTINVKRMVSTPVGGGTFNPGTPVVMAGATGQTGSSLLTGTTAPSNALGNNGDTYINTSTGQLYGAKTDDAWPTTPLSLVGPQGPSGTGSGGGNWTLNGDDVYRSVGRVGIGTSNIDAKLYLKLSQDDYQGGFTIESNDQNRLHLYYKDGGWTWDSFRFSDSRRAPLAFNPNGGNLGVGLKNPTEILHVKGNFKVQEGTIKTPSITFDDGTVLSTVPSAGGGSGITAVTTDNTLTGNGTSGSPLKVNKAVVSKTFAEKALIIYDGNSLWAGRGSSHEISSPDDFSAGPFPSTVQNYLAGVFPSSQLIAKNFGVSGQQTPAMISDAATQIDALYNPTTYARNIIFCGEITNHIADGGATAQAALDSYMAFCKARRAAGFTVIVTTVLPRTTNFGSGMSASEFESRRTVVNNYLRLNWPKFSDGIADIAALTGITYPDGTHPNDAGYAIIAGLAGPKLADLIERGFNPTTLAMALGNGGITSGGGSTTSTSSALVQLDGQGANNSTTFTDAGGHVFTANGNAKISTTQYKYGSSSMYFDGSSNSYISTPTKSDLDLGTGDFTMETWLYKTGNGSGFPGIIARGDASENQWTWCFPSSGNRPDLFIRNGGSYVQLNLNSSADVPLNQWVHLALTRSGTTFKLWQNGTQVGSTTSSLSMESQSSGKPLTVGGFTGVGAGTDVLPAYMHVKITKGSALYTAAFTPANFDASTTTPPSSTTTGGGGGGGNSNQSQYQFAQADSTVGRPNRSAMTTTNVSNDSQLRSYLTSNLSNTRLVLADGDYPGYHEQTGNWNNVELVSLTRNARFIVTDGTTCLLLQGGATRTNIAITGINFESTASGGGNPLLWWNELPIISGIEVGFCTFKSPNSFANGFGSVQYSTSSNMGNTANNVYIHNNNFQNVGRCGIEMLSQGYDGVFRMNNATVAYNYFKNLGLNDSEGYGMAVSFSGLFNRIMVIGNYAEGTRRMAYEFANCRNVTGINNSAKRISYGDGVGYAISDDHNTKSTRNIRLEGGTFDMKERPFYAYNADSLYIDGKNQLWKGHLGVETNTTKSVFTGMNILIHSTDQYGGAGWNITGQSTYNTFKDMTCSSAGAAAAGYQPNWEQMVVRENNANNTFINVTTILGRKSDGTTWAPDPTAGSDGRIVVHQSVTGSTTITNNIKSVVN